MLKWVLAVLLFVPLTGQATVVRLSTVLGTIDIALMDDEAPRTVANFLAYVNRGAYDNSFIHRSLPGFVIQGGGYTWDDAIQKVMLVPTGAPVANEFSSSRSNVRGTVAMAKLPDQPDSATSGWFINLADNSANLDNQNGGFTVFSRVTGEGMAVVDAIAALTAPPVGPFENLPLISVPAPGSAVTGSDLVIVKTVTVLPGPGTASDSDRVFNYLEAAFPQYITPSSQPTGTSDIYTYRYYPGTGAYVGTADGMLYYLGPAYKNGTEPYLLGSLAEWLAIAAQAGY
ncbi:MAG: hypothetical protein A3H32_00470 [Betaproteobacteria bacterium RIFCSPLOWO2_02_FULL_63_19]|nr:MAG: hypothetical protein A3H32_00470 [Betaproteobacteria bacterium RIFCSPLOWO2_02_FULL_63_19]